jgi:hypothetical protein
LLIDISFIPANFAFRGICHPTKSLYNGPRTDKSRLVPADIHHPKNMPKNACPIPQISLFGAYAIPQILPETTARKDKSRLVLGILPTRKICPRVCLNSANFAFRGICHPAKSTYNGPRTDKSRLVPADIHHPKNMPKNACPNPQISPNGAYAYPQISPKTTARTDKSRLVPADILHPGHMP